MEGCIKKETVPPFLTVQVIVDVLIWLAVGIPVLVLYLNSSPYKAGFFCDDTSLKYPYKKNTISDALLTGVAFSVTAITLLLVEILNRFDKKNRCSFGNPFTCLKGFGIFLFGFVMEQLFTEVLKDAVGRLRPNFFDVCRPDFSNIDCGQRYVTNYTCTNDEHSATILRDSHRSFPSGHAAFSMYTSMYLVFYLEKRLDVSYSHILKPTMQAALILMALLCSVSRITDLVHHPSDVTAGVILGLIVACAVFYSLGTKCLNVGECKKASISEDIERNSNPTLTGCQTTLTLLQNEFANHGQPDYFSSKCTNRNSNSVTV
ncbi:hypothetical protein CHS0354_021810 [Potamilus streckersoni]|uniref:Phosphatidic acid phosphatase type 2/haloperoxidase domain-containing protein n=1 Tax=Potamilus streckersoni TaxID=2493646 RepID=A0AAE0S455_9BIVA|nr:hypothetical protein CHS0354_021810 [Potamilus streckersoni]